MKRTLVPTAPISLLLVPLLMQACASEPQTASAPTPQTIDAASFRDPDVSPAPAPSSRQAPRVATEAPTPRENVVALVGGPDDADFDSVAPSSTPEQPSPAATTINERLIVDRMVGQINGQPQYASDFFREMDARLRAEAQKRPAREWIAFASEQISRELSTRIRDELLLAEFQSALSPEERQGVLGFLSYLRQDVIRQNLGSEAEADSRLRATEGLTINEYLQREKERRFIGEQVDREINSRVNVSYRDIKQRYERDRDKYEPKPIAVLRVIRVQAADAATRQSVSNAFARGDAPKLIASEYDASTARQDGLMKKELENRDYRSQEFFPQPELNEPTRALNVGETTDPIEHGSSVYWIHLEEIEQPESKSLYDVQLQIERELQQEFLTEEQRRYFTQVYARGSYTDIVEMQRQLLQFAVERYLILQTFNESDQSSSASNE